LRLADIREACVFVLPWLPGDGGRKGVLRQARDADLDGMVMRVERDIARVNEALYGQLASKVASAVSKGFNLRLAQPFAVLPISAQLKVMKDTPILYWRSIEIDVQ
jgi:hypothetical protein